MNSRHAASFALEVVAEPHTPSKQPKLGLLGQAGKSIALIAVFFMLESYMLSLYFASMPKMEASVAQVVRDNLFPKLTTGHQHNVIQRAAAVRAALLKYSVMHPVQTAAAISFSFIYLQTFALPGTSGLSLLAGAFFGTCYGLALIAVNTLVGALSCYTLSSVCGKDLAYAIWPERMRRFAAQVKEREMVLLNYIIFLRVTPFLPNTFINAAAPIIGVPVAQFAIGTLVGSSPSNFLVVNAGSHLTEISSLRDLYDVRVVMLIIAFAVLALLPVYLRHRWEQKKDRIHVVRSD